MSAADETRKHEHRRESIERRIACVDKAIALWGAWEANRAPAPIVAQQARWPRISARDQQRPIAGA
jgi:hypothetical protein